MDPRARLAIRDKVQSCTACALHAQCRGPVPFSGHGKIVVVGEAPGPQEDAQGEPFVGPSGQLLRSQLQVAGIEGAAFVNAVSCYPNRTPTPAELAACRGNLVAQLDHLAPDYLLAAGGIAASAFWPNARISDLRGNWWKMGDRWVFATWHPSAVLRNTALSDEFAADLESFKLGVDHGPWRNWWCVKCGHGTSIVVGPDGRQAAYGMPLCAKHYATMNGTIGGGKKKATTKVATRHKRSDQQTRLV